MFRVLVPGGRIGITDVVAEDHLTAAVVAPCRFQLDDAAVQAELAARQLPGIPVWAIDADGLIVRPGPRLVDGVEALAAIVHPGQAAAAPAGRIRRIA
jgi:iron complex transport system substrate-binding protein